MPSARSRPSRTIGTIGVEQDRLPAERKTARRGESFLQKPVAAPMSGSSLGVAGPALRHDPGRARRRRRPAGPTAAKALLVARRSCRQDFDRTSTTASPVAVTVVEGGEELTKEISPTTSPVLSREISRPYPRSQAIARVLSRLRAGVIPLPGSGRER